MTQPDLFSVPPPVIGPRLGVVPPEERQRLSTQCRAILARLQAGPATNRHLSDIGLNYRARVSELRQHGYNVQVIERDTKTGRSVYALIQSN